jgi:hypothetical protein
MIDTDRDGAISHDGFIALNKSSDQERPVASCALVCHHFREIDALPRLATAAGVVRRTGA